MLQWARLPLVAAMRLHDGCWLYVLRCSDGSLYTGTTRSDVETRVGQHNAGLHPGSYTFNRRPVALAFAEHFPDITDAIAMERRVKGWSRRKKLAMIAGRWDLLPELAKRGS
jgi:putative endonuclease